MNYPSDTPERQASYEESSFCINVENLKFDVIGQDDNNENIYQICKEDFPAFMHEWWHYIQDIAFVSAQNGFYLWLRDLARIQKYIVESSEENIHIPLPYDQYGELMNKDRIIFFENLGGDGDDGTIKKSAVIDCDPTYKDIVIKNNGQAFTIKSCLISVGGKEKCFGIYALQELNSFYLQKIAEAFFDGINFTIPADAAPTFPYHIGDKLFQYYDIKCDIRTKFIISTLCLDSLDAPYTFIEVLKKYKGQELNYNRDRSRLIKDICQLQNIEKIISAIDSWVKDYKEWTGDKGWAEPLKDAIQWYIQTLYEFQCAKEKYGKDIIALTVSYNLEGMTKLYSSAPAPLLKHGGMIKGSQNDSLHISKDTQKSFDSAMAIWSCRRIYEMLICRRKEKIKELSKCELYANCPYKEKIGKEYDCALSPISIVKNMKKAECPYALAEWMLGLWQKDVSIDI